MTYSTEGTRALGPSSNATQFVEARFVFCENRASFRDRRSDEVSRSGCKEWLVRYLARPPHLATQRNRFTIVSSKTVQDVTRQ